MIKLIEKIYSINQMESVQNFVIKKLNVPDLFKVRDRYEGHAFLLNTIKRIFTLYALLDYLGIDNYEGIKVGYLNTVDLREFCGVEIKYFENIEDADSKIIVESGVIYSYINNHYRKCVLYGFDSDLSEVKNTILKNLEKVKNIVYV
jgi:hypothetical protein